MVPKTFPYSWPGQINVTKTEKKSPILFLLLFRFKFKYLKNCVSTFVANSILYNIGESDF